MGAILGHGAARRRPLNRALAAVIRVLSRLNRAHAVVQNSDDRDFVIAGGVAPAGRVVLIPGSGVDVAAFAPAPEPEGPVTAMMVSRLLRDKGVGELVEAAQLLRARGTALRVWIVGDRDPENPRSVTQAEIASWTSTADVAFLGRRDDVAALWRQAHIAVLPSYYGEGVPKSLLEAAASGRAIVTTDMPGCRDLVPDGRTGARVAPRDAAGLADALERLVRDPAGRREMGARARQLALDQFSEAQVIAATQALYRRLLGLGDAPPPEATLSRR
jgi:glycosyltransferase involved in cell wall biosynthesis